MSKNGLWKLLKYQDPLNPSSISLRDGLGSLMSKNFLLHQRKVCVKHDSALESLEKLAFLVPFAFIDFWNIIYFLTLLNQFHHAYWLITIMKKFKTSNQNIESPEQL